MNRFSMCMLDLMTVLLLSVMALVSVSDTVDAPSGLLDEAFVLLEFEASGVTKMQVGPKEHFLVVAPGQDTPQPSLLIATQNSVSTTKGSPVSASITCENGEIKEGSIFVVSSFTSPIRLELGVDASAGGVLTNHIVDLRGRRRGPPLNLPGNATIHVDISRMGTGIETCVSTENRQ